MLYLMLPVFSGASLYPVNNTGISVTGALGAVPVFPRKLRPLNLAGLGIAVPALALLSYQKLDASLF